MPIPNSGEIPGHLVTLDSVAKSLCDGGVYEVFRHFPQFFGTSAFIAHAEDVYYRAMALGEGPAD